MQAVHQGNVSAASEVDGSNNEEDESNGGNGGSSEQAPDRETSGPLPMVCLVPGCGADLTEGSHYLKRHRICHPHLKALSVQLNGVDCRFCQQCGRFQPVGEFRGERRSCEAALQAHNARRRVKRDSSTECTDRRARIAAKRTLQAYDQSSSEDEAPSASRRAAARRHASQRKAAAAARADAASAHASAHKEKKQRSGGKSASDKLTSGSEGVRTAGSDAAARTEQHDAGSFSSRSPEQSSGSADPQQPQSFETQQGVCTQKQELGSACGFGLDQKAAELQAAMDAVTSMTAAWFHITEGSNSNVALANKNLAGLSGHGSRHGSGSSGNGNGSSSEMLTVMLPPQQQHPVHPVQQPLVPQELAHSLMLQQQQQQQLAHAAVSGAHQSPAAQALLRPVAHAVPTRLHAQTCCDVSDLQRLGTQHNVEQISCDVNAAAGVTNCVAATRPTHPQHQQQQRLTAVSAVPLQPSAPSAALTAAGVISQSIPAAAQPGNPSEAAAAAATVALADLDNADAEAILDQTLDLLLAAYPGWQVINDAPGATSTGPSPAESYITQASNPSPPLCNEAAATAAAGSARGLQQLQQTSADISGLQSAVHSTTCAADSQKSYGMNSGAGVMPGHSCTMHTDMGLLHHQSTRQQQSVGASSAMPMHNTGTIWAAGIGVGAAAAAGLSSSVLLQQQQAWGLSSHMPPHNTGVATGNAAAESSSMLPIKQQIDLGLSSAVSAQQALPLATSVVSSSLAMQQQHSHLLQGCYGQQLSPPQRQSPPQLLVQSQQHSQSDLQAQHIAMQRHYPMQEQHSDSVLLQQQLGLHLLHQQQEQMRAVRSQQQQQEQSFNFQRQQQQQQSWPGLGPEFAQQQQQQVSAYSNGLPCPTSLPYNSTAAVVQPQQLQHAANQQVRPLHRHQYMLPQQQQQQQYVFGQQHQQPAVTFSHQLVRMSIKLHGVTPDQLPAPTVAALNKLLTTSAAELETLLLGPAMRPGCTQLELDVLVKCPRSGRQQHEQMGLETAAASEDSILQQEQQQQQQQLAVGPADSTATTAGSVAPTAYSVGHEATSIDGQRSMDQPDSLLLQAEQQLRQLVPFCEVVEVLLDLMHKAGAGTVPAGELADGSNGVNNHKAAPDAQPQPDSQAAPDAQPGPDSQAAPDAQPQPDSQDAPDTQPGPDSQAAPDAQPGPDSQDAPDTQPGPDSQAAPTSMTSQLTAVYAQVGSAIGAWQNGRLVQDWNHNMNDINAAEATAALQSYSSRHADRSSVEKHRPVLLSAEPCVISGMTVPAVAGGQMQVQVRVHNPAAGNQIQRKEIKLWATVRGSFVQLSCSSMACEQQQQEMVLQLRLQLPEGAAGLLLIQGEVQMQVQQQQLADGAASTTAAATAAGAEQEQHGASEHTNISIMSNLLPVVMCSSADMAAECKQRLAALPHGSGQQMLEHLGLLLDFEVMVKQQQQQEGTQPDGLTVQQRTHQQQLLVNRQYLSAMRYIGYHLLVSALNNSMTATAATIGGILRILQQQKAATGGSISAAATASDPTATADVVPADAACCSAATAQATTDLAGTSRAGVESSCEITSSSDCSNSGFVEASKPGSSKEAAAAAAGSGGYEASTNNSSSSKASKPGSSLESRQSGAAHADQSPIHILRAALQVMGMLLLMYLLIDVAAAIAKGKKPVQEVVRSLKQIKSLLVLMIVPLSMMLVGWLLAVFQYGGHNNTVLMQQRQAAGGLSAAAAANTKGKVEPATSRDAFACPC